MSRRALMVALVVTHVALAQALPRASAAGTPDDASALLTRAREKILESIRRLPKYTCLETIDRAYYLPPPEKHSVHMMTEDRPTTACIGNQASYLLLAAKDRLRVEVAAAEGVEIHSWPGASQFDTRSFDQMIPSGPLSTGSFGTSLLDVFANPAAEIKFTVQKDHGLRKVFEYSFRVPLGASHNAVKGSRGWRITGFSGSFQIDAATADLVSLVVETDPLAPDTGMCQARISTDYHFALMGDGEFLLPRRSAFNTFDTDGGQTDSVTEFSACREYTAESDIRFDYRDTPVESLPTSRSRFTAVPPGLSLTLALASAIDLDTAAAGDPVTARIVRPVRAPGTNGFLVPAEALARGRILEMRHELTTSEFLISINFDTLEMNGAVLPLSVRLAREIKAEKRARGRFVMPGTEFSLPPIASPTPGSYFAFAARSGKYVIPAGFQSKWTTLAP